MEHGFAIDIADTFRPRWKRKARRRCAESEQQSGGDRRKPTPMLVRMGMATRTCSVQREKAAKKTTPNKAVRGYLCLWDFPD